MPKRILETQFIYTRRLQHIVRYIIAIATASIGMADMFSAIAPKNNIFMQLGVWPAEVHRTQIHAQTLTVVVGFFLVMLSYGLGRGKRHVWLTTILLLLISAVFLHVLRGGSVLATFFSLLLIVALVACEPLYRAKSDPPSVRQGYVALTLGLAIVIFYTIGGFLELYDNFEALIDRFGIDGVILRILTMEHWHFPHHEPAFFFERVIPLLCLSAIVYGMIKLLRPVAAVLLPDLEMREKVSETVRLHGHNSISYFALDSDKSYFFSSSGKAVISYVLQGSTAVVAGDPIGPASELPIAVQEFLTFCQQQDWTIVFWQVRAQMVDLYQRMGLHLLKIGEDAVIDTSAFTLKGGAMANVRTSVKRAEKEGVRAVFYHGRITDSEQLAQVEAISQAWLAKRNGSEMGFSMGHFDPQGDSEQIYVVAVSDANRVHAFVSFIPIYGRNGWGLDLMRRAEQCAPGVMELLLTRSIEYLRGAGAEMVSLGLAPLSNVNNDEGTFLDNSLDFIIERFSILDKGQSLFSFKKKFHPVWESRFLVYSDALSLPKIGYALYYAHQRDASLVRVLQHALVGSTSSVAGTRTSTTGALETLNV